VKLLLLSLLLSACTATAVTTTAPRETIQEQRPVQVFIPSMLPPGPAAAQGYEWWMQRCETMTLLQEQITNTGYQSIRGFRALDDPDVCALLVRQLES